MVNLLIAHRFLRNARWRQRPATEAQKNFVEKRLSRHGQQSKELDRKLEGLTSGNCADLITRFKHGALVSTELFLLCEYMPLTAN